MKKHKKACILSCILMCGLAGCAGRIPEAAGIGCVPGALQEKGIPVPWNRTLAVMETVLLEERAEETGEAPGQLPGTEEKTARLEQAEPGQGGQQDPDRSQTEPGSAEPSEPGPAEPSEPGSAEPSEPGPAEPSEPGPAEPSEPEPPAQELPTPEPPAQEPMEPKSIYDYEFDIEAIRQELIALGEGAGLTHTTTDDGVEVTPGNASWATPVTASESFQGENLKQRLADYVQSMPGIINAYGGNPITYFTIYTEPLGGGSYRIYFLY